MTDFTDKHLFSSSGRSLFERKYGFTLIEVLKESYHVHCLRSLYTSVPMRFLMLHNFRGYHPFLNKASIHFPDTIETHFDSKNQKNNFNNLYINHLCSRYSQRSAFLARPLNESVSMALSLFHYNFHSIKPLKYPSPIYPEEEPIKLVWTPIH